MLVKRKQYLKLMIIPERTKIIFSKIFAPNCSEEVLVVKEL